MPENIRGMIKKVFYTSGTWSALIAESEQKKTFRASGTILNPVEKTSMIFTGEWVTDPKYGKQLKVTKAEPARDMTRAGMIAFLSSGYVKGVGEKTAEAIVDRFGPETMHIIENEPLRLAEIPRINEKKAMVIHEANRTSCVYRELYDLIPGATDLQIRKVYDTYGNDAIDVIHKNPYQLIYDIDGFGFKIVDGLALSSGVKPNADVRIAAAITYILHEMADRGHCFSSVSAVQAHLEELIGMLDVERVADIVVQEIKNGHLILDEERLYTDKLYHRELFCAEAIARMLKRGPAKIIREEDVLRRIDETELRAGFRLETKQTDAIRAAVNHRLSVITGGPGTGKTTIVQGILNCWNDPSTVHLLAPTGKASRRMSEVCNGMEAITIHKCLYAKKWKELKNKDKPHLIVTDEASMLDISLAAGLLEFAEEVNANLVLIGDIDQLPPIGPGYFFRDLVQSPLIPTVTLELSHRQHGKIAINADSINKGRGMSHFLYDPSFEFIYADKEVAQETVLNAYYRLAEVYPLQDICCIVPMRVNSSKDPNSKRVVSDTLNQRIRERLNPERADRKKLKGCTFRIGDRVMQTVNDYKKDVFNGDCGIVQDVDLFDSELIVRMDDGRRVSYSAVEANQTLVLAYAMTVHKSQGSEYKAVVLAQCWEHYVMLQRNLLYTGVTRAREKVVLIGETKAINLAISKVPAMERNTWLRHRIKRLIM